MSMRNATLLGLAVFILPACADEIVNPAPGDGIYEGTLAVEIRGSATISIATRAGGAVDITLKPDEIGASGILDPAVSLAMSGRVEAFPETGSELYTAKASLPSPAGGPCGSDPMSLALSLHRRGNNSRVGGALTVYCGEGRFYGVPARVLRLSGEIATR
jgi:hypothetical protein